MSTLVIMLLVRYATDMGKELYENRSISNGQVIHLNLTVN